MRMDESALRTLIANLERCRSPLHGWLEAFTWLVVIGVAIEVVFVIWEYREELHDFNRGIIHAPEHPKKSMFVVGLLGAGLVAIGVAGELRVGAKIETLETRIRKANGDLLLLLSKEAGDAATSVKTAHEELDRVKSETAKLEARLSAASTQLDAIEQRVRVQGPRWKQLEDNKSEFIRALTPFAPQRVTIIETKCGDAVQTEPHKLAVDLVNILGVFDLKPNAGWKGGIYRVWHTCKVWPTAEGGNLVVTSSSARQSVKDAAKALDGTLNKIGISTMGIIIPDSPEFRAEVDTDEGTDSPESLALKDPTQIFIMVGTNPMTVDTFGERKLHKRSRP
jgi:hypothetical protein